VTCISVANNMYEKPTIKLVSVSISAEYLLQGAQCRRLSVDGSTANSVNKPATLVT